ncbi:serine/threonine protein kinase [Paractinoplanes abujensis]|uniref:non-specific serine/threonine protein kinase n=1 Tax=Paractinoplanes abujensis TaxID=882441 RepID=A0A7W7G374_9ACTN|nr:Stk1 family PASTA domain-containing Ser/Thr kinase [Actinoplanes abujensis]MBB4696038.1 serine/threonine-protein kinase [Actinoplanes abujensis]GID22026.1 serine/threonine protein kinase [Actinoplanes abujensis]
MTAQARLLGGRYQVGELLGYGGMAEVHRGRDLRLGRDVAIKMLRTDLARDATFQERFRREAQNSAALNHPAIVAVYDTGEEISSTGEKLPFIVMEFVNGRTLKEVLAQEQRIPTRRALEMIADICAALEFSHRHGIIHRDIKPGNVMITQNGQVKVMDFGIARALASGATTMTQTSAVIGTAQYLSPEQARGESVDARSDVYAAGCVLFELLVGHPPFVGDSPVSVAYQHVREEPKAPSDINHEVPPDVDAIVLKALAKNPMNRYQSAQEMRADALRAVAGRPVLATPVMTEAETMAMQGPPSRQWQPQAATTMQRPVAGGPRPPERRSTWVWASLAALGVLVVIVLGVALAQMRNNANETNAGDTPTSAPVTYKMPDLEGKTDAEALALLKTAGISDIDRDEPQISQDCDGTVIKQVPQANATVAADQQVRYQLCQKPDKVEVPDDLVGSTRDAAKSRLEGLGFKVKFEEVPSLKQEGTVVKVEKAGQTVEPGQTLTVQISNARQTRMPDVVGKSVATAMGTLDNAGPFNVNTVLVQDPNGVPGTVVEQNPRANSTVTKGDKVTLTVVAEPDPNETTPDPDDTESPGTGGTGNAGGTGSGSGTNGLINYPITPVRRD